MSASDAPGAAALAGERYEASANQAGLFATHALGRDYAAAANVNFQIAWEGALDVAALRRAFSRVARRHDALRTAFLRDGRRVVAVVDARAELPCTEHDLRAGAPGGEDAWLAGFEARDAAAPFDLGVAPLARVAAVHLTGDRGRLFFAFHHAVIDGLSATAFWKELGAAYADELAGTPDDAPPPEAQLSAHARAEHAALATPEAARDLATWGERLAGSPAFPALELGEARPEDHFTAGVRASVTLREDVARRVRELARDAKVTPFVVGLAAVKLLLARATGETDGVVFSTFANRKRGRGVLGYLVNALPLRDRVDLGAGFRSLLDDVADGVRFARAYAHVPGALVARAHLAGEGGVPWPLLNVLVDGPPAEYAEASRVVRPELRMELVGLSSPLAARLTVAITASTEAITLHLRYAASVAEQPALARVAAALATLLDAATDDPDGPVGALPLVDEAGVAELLALGDGGAAPRPRWLEAGLAARLRAEALRSPFATALVADAGGSAPATRLSRRALEARIARAAARLTEAGAAAGRFVLVARGAGLGAVTGVLAALRIGAPWLVLPADQGDARVARACAATRPAAVVAPASEREAWAARAPGAAFVPLERLVDGADADDANDAPPHPPPPPPAPDALAYAVLTSGTSGVPKLVGVSRGALEAQLAALEVVGLLGRAPRVPLLAPLGFDAALEQLLLPLLGGGVLLLPGPDGVADAPRLLAFLRDEGATALDAVPSVAKALLGAGLADPDLAPPFARAVLGGEPLADALVAELGAALPACTVLDTYGPTETTINATWANRSAGERFVGRALPGVTLEITDDGGGLVPRGVAGELRIGGVCVGAGYLGDDEATARAFVGDSLGRRAYRSGDRARWTEGGALELLGRRDAQVKIRGVRVDLREIEDALVGAPGVREASVRRRELGGRAALVAIVALDAPSPAAVDALRAHLTRALPAAHVPDHVVRVDRLPRLASGKLDGAALDALALADAAPSEGPTPEASPLAARVGALLGDALGRRALAADEDFFAAGGDSLALVAALALADARGVALDLAAVRAYRTPRGIAAALAAREAEGAARGTDALPPPSLDDAFDARDAVRAQSRRAPKPADPLAHVVLTGATGLFGVHVLDALLARPGGCVTCVVRAPARDDAAATARLDAMYRRAFPGRPETLARAAARVRVVAGGLDADGPAGLPRADALGSLGAPTALVHAAAEVAWTADARVLEDVNVGGTARVARLARQLGIPLHHVSSTSVSSAAARRVPYVASKVAAERAALASGAETTLWRVGLLAGRVEDGAFPVAGGEQGVRLLFGALLGDGDVPAALGAARLALTPVDACAARLVALVAQGGEPPIVVLDTDAPVAAADVLALRGDVPPPPGARVPASALGELLEPAERDDAKATSEARLRELGLAWPRLGAPWVRAFAEALAQRRVGPVPGA